MSTESVPKPRFVLCPKCWQLLQEAPDLDVYKCGGCGTTLQGLKSVIVYVLTFKGVLSNSSYSVVEF